MFNIPQNGTGAASPGQNLRSSEMNGAAHGTVPQGAAQQRPQPRPQQPSRQIPPQQRVQRNVNPLSQVSGVQQRPPQQRLPQKPKAQDPSEKTQVMKIQSAELDAKTTEVKVSEQAAVKKTVKRSEFSDSGTASKLRTVKKEPEERLKFADGEGGNTVVSLIKAIVYIIFVVVISVFASIFIILVGNDVFAFVKNDEVRDVVIPENADLGDVADVLYENDIIAYPQIFKLYAHINGEDGKTEDGKSKFVAGTYSISPMYNYDELLVAFEEKVDYGVQDIMIPEGYTTDEIIDLFVSKGIGTREGFVDVINNYDFDYWFIDELGEDWGADGRIYRLDGYLFPDTYQFYNNSSEVTVIKRLLRRFNQIFTEEYREQCASMGYTVDEMITLASMIEKEAGSAAEFFYVSSVFHNRLNNPAAYPKLESDATIVYAIQHETGERPNLTSTTYETPYNTYTYGGLPPGPIANPSASAILAALSPVKSGYYFFISDGGVTKFSETRAQHEALIAEIRQKSQAASSSQQTGDMSAEEAANSLTDNQ
ncbi:MAG: endolytic transglycosylase MltG [Ruminococcaceae bacterium]|nr:endolytic transglycosylase MltG [Oscillospiraceae bacterium]